MTGRRARSAITGRFVSLWWAIRHRKQAVLETVKKTSRDQ